MEDALAHDEDNQSYSMFTDGLNPCCNGRCTRTAFEACKKIVSVVLILVVMEDALAQQNLGYALFKRIVRLDCASKDLLLTNIMYLLSECKITKN